MTIRLHGQCRNRHTSIVHPDQPPTQATRRGPECLPAAGAEDAPKPSRRSSEKTVTQLHEQAPEDLRNLYDSLEAYLLSLGDDVTKTTRQLYYAFRRIKNFACVEIHPQSKKLLVYLKTDPDSIALEPGFTRDVTKIGHFGTGNLEVTLGSADDFERAQPLIQMSYQAS